MDNFTRFDSGNKKQIEEAATILLKAYEYYKEGIFTKRDASEYALSEEKTETPMPSASNFSEMITILENFIFNNGKMNKIAPTEGRIRYFGEKDSHIVGAYSDGVLEAAIYTGRWETNEILTMKIEKLAEVWGNRRTT